MQKREKKKRQEEGPLSSSKTPDPLSRVTGGPAEQELQSVLDERLQNLQEALDELDRAVADRNSLNQRFRDQIRKEMKEVLYQLDHLNPPWKTGFHPELEFFRLSLHKSLTSRRKDIRAEELKYWEHITNLLKDKRKILDEYKALAGTKRRLG